MVPDQQQHRRHSKLGFMIITEKRKSFDVHVLFNLSHLTPSEEPTNAQAHKVLYETRKTHQPLLQLIKAEQHLILWEICKCSVIKLHRHRHLPPSLNLSSRPSSSFSLHHAPSSFLTDTSLCFFAQDGDVFRRRRG